MHHLKFLNARAVVLAAVALAALAVGMFAVPRDSATAAFSDPTGVFCADLVDFGGIAMSRFELDDNPGDGNPNDVAVTTVQYTPDGGADCQDSPPLPICGSGETLGECQSIKGVARPSLSAKWDAAQHKITGSICSENAAFGGVTFPGWTKISTDFDLDPDPDAKTNDSNAFEVRTDQDPGSNPPSTCTDTGGTSVIQVAVTGVWLDGPSSSTGGFSHDWDGGGRRDWDELTTDAKGRGDPFNPADDAAGGVGGVAELPDQRSTSLQTSDSSSSSTTMIIAIASAGVAAVFATGGAAWALRKHVIR